MIYIYKSDYIELRDKKELNEFLLKLPIKMQERANRYKFEKDTYNFVMGRLLLKKGLEVLGLDNLLDQITYQKAGKPLLKDVFFNISHTRNLVVCALSTEGNIGIDVEKVKQVNFDDFRPWFTNSEWANINEAAYPIRKFYWYWTRKESIIKALGVSLSYLHKIEADATQDIFFGTGKKWYLKDLDFGSDYVGALCSEYPINELKINL